MKGARNCSQRGKEEKRKKKNGKSCEEKKERKRKKSAGQFCGGWGRSYVWRERWLVSLVAFFSPTPIFRSETSFLGVRML